MVDERVEFCFSKGKLLVFSDLDDDFACLLVAAAEGKQVDFACSASLLWCGALVNTM